MLNKLIIRTSDRSQFRQCRQHWNFTSKIRQDFEYSPSKVYFDFGTGIHSGMEVLYDPQRWPWAGQEDLLLAEAILAFQADMDDWKKRLIATNQWDSTKQEWKEHIALGKGMLEHYMAWAPRHDVEWRPRRTEVEFEVAIPVPKGYPLPTNFFRSKITGHLYKRVPNGNGTFEMVQVVYQGRIDLIMEYLPTGRLWIWDHKTAARLDSTEHLELDTQGSSYAWACSRMLGLDVEGIMWQQLRKGYPKPPNVLQSGRLSQNKGQDTTYDMYLQAIKENNEDPADYTSFLDFLKSSEDVKEYFRRVDVPRNQIEIDSQEINILEEALDMLDDPRIYPNPSQWNCRGCLFHAPCVMKQDGSDWKGYLESSNLYVRRSDVKERSLEHEEESV